jgi:serine/threonine protein kinase
MPLDKGTRIGPYEILGPLGAGGMGEVYRARDSKLHREVALKVLPAALSGDPEYLARFQREAQALAALNHSNIAQIYGIESDAIAMELVEGHDLRGPLPLDEALKIARQIAEALEAAHERGIVHRDLKPENIKITPDGTVKVLDFGLAKNAEIAPAQNTANSPTVTLRATQAGAILGTPAYMSPEQARGHYVDRRSDIWSFGAVFFEMLSGKQAFQGDSIADLLAAVVLKDPDWSELPPDTPPHIVQLLHRCLTRDRRLRLQAIGEARIAIDTPPGPVAPPAVDNKRRLLGGILALAFIVAAASTALLYFSMRQQPAASPARFIVTHDSLQRIVAASVSPDGRYLAFYALEQGKNQSRLFLRPLDSLTTREIPGTESGSVHFWSPDSRSIAFVSDRKLKRVFLDGQPNVETIASLDNPAFATGSNWNSAGGTWSASGDILLGGLQSGILRVDQKTGTIAPVTSPAAGALHSSPLFLPDGQHFLFTEISPAGMKIYMRDLDSGKQAYLFDADAPTTAFLPGRKQGAGYVIFSRDSAVVARAVDWKSAKVTGKQVLLAADQGRTGSISASDGGAVAALDRSPPTLSQAKWLDRNGTQVGAIGEARRNLEARLTRDGRTALLSDGASNGMQIWIHDLDRGIVSRLNPDAPGIERTYAVAISPDGRIAFSAAGPGKPGDIYAKSLNGAGKAELLLASSNMKHPNDWSHDGRFLIYDDHAGATRQDLWILPLEGDRKPFPFVATSADETLAQFSPDDKWVAYQSDESGRPEIYVQGFAPGQSPAAANGKWQISNSGGRAPHWRGDGKELFYVSLDGKMMAVPIRSTAPFSPGAPVPLFDVALRFAGGFPYDVTADGSRFLVDMNEKEGTESRLLVLINTLAALEEPRQ